ncbi:MAG: winged helix-turn-helix domain-containing protein [Aeromicrobium sp.]
MSHQIDLPARKPLDHDILRLWARRSPDIQTVVLLEPDVGEAQRLTEGLAPLGLRVLSCTDPLRALAHVGLDASLVIASVRIGPDALTRVVDVVHSETTVPVLIAYGAGDVEAIGPAIVAGGRPVIALPYDVHDVAVVLQHDLPPPPPPPLVEFGGLSLVPNWYDTRYRGHAIDLSRLEFDLLLELASQNGRAVLRTTLIEALWPNGSKDTKSLLTAAIKRIRTKFEPLGIDQAVRTVRGIGYRLDRQVLCESGIEAAK